VRPIGGGLRRIRNHLFRVVFFGRGCFCVFCRKSYRRFLHHGVRARVFRRHRVSGAGYRKNARCPNCRSNQRTRLLYLFFQHRTTLYHDPVRLLHLSPKKKLGRIFSGCENIEYTCGALAPQRFAEFDAVAVDVRKIPFPENRFDVLICNHILEHVPEDRIAIQELYRVLRPGGFGVLQVPLAVDLPRTLEDPSVQSERARKREYGQKDHVRLYGQDFFRRLEEAGFRVERDNPFENQWIPDLERHRLDPIEDVVVAHKD